MRKDGIYFLKCYLNSLKTFVLSNDVISLNKIENVAVLV